MATNVQVKETGNAVADPSTLFEGFAEFAGEGMEHIGTEDMQLPFLRIIQPLSPEVNKMDPKFIKGASAGDLFNTVTGQVWAGDEGCVVIPCGYAVKYLEFAPRGTQGGGFFGELAPNSPDVRNTTREGAAEILPNGNELIRSAQHLVLIVGDDGSVQQAICDMKKTQMKVSKRWNTQMKMIQYKGANGLFTPPMWGTAWRLTVVSESNDKGSWFNYNVAKVDPTEVPADAFMAAKAFYQSFNDGEVKTSAGTADELNETKSNQVSDDIPF